MTVAFRSDGGSLVAGIRIGTLIREKKFATVIPDGASCASACALAWLGGARRFMGEGASVGFHAAYVLKSYGPVESGSGNAILGAYLNQLGLSEDAILYITKTAPTSIQWMNLDDANEHGIAAATLSPQQGVAPFHRGGDRGTARRRARSAAPPISCASLFAHWSKPSAEAHADARGPVRGDRRLPRQVDAAAGGLVAASASVAEPLDRARLHHPTGLAVGDVRQGPARPAA